MKVQKQTQPVLIFAKEFEQVLRGYKPSAASIATLKDTALVLMVGPTAAGRNTLMSLLTQTGRYHYVASDTTRPRRMNNGVMEEDGVEYWFKSEEAVLDGLKKGKYIEAAIIHHQQVSGMHIEQLESASKKVEISLIEIEIKGAATYRSYKPDVLTVFLLPPDFETWMKRIKGRGQMSEEELRRRLQSAQSEIAAALADENYHFVINHEVHEAAVMVDELANGRAAPDASGQAMSRAHAEQLAIDVQLYLNA